jgi:hypothetical protein
VSILTSRKALLKYFLSVTCVRLSIKSVDIAWVAGRSTIVVVAPDGLKLTSNDRAGQSHRKIASFQLPNAAIRLLLASNPRRTSWVEAMELLADVYIDAYSLPPGWMDTARMQRAFIQGQDTLTGRAKVLFDVHGSSSMFCLVTS